MKKNIAKSLALALALVTTTNNTTSAEDINIEVVGGGHIETISNKTIEIHPEGDCHYIESYDASSKKMKIVITEECNGNRRFDIPFKEIGYIEFQAPYTYPGGHTYMYLDLTNAPIGTYRFPIMAHSSWQYLDLSWNYKNSTGKRVSTRTNREENVWEISITQAYYDVTLKDGLNNDITSTIKTSQSLPNGSGVAGYTFAGWYRNSSHTGEKVTSMSQITGNTTLYAKYVPNKYNLILNIDGKVEKQSVTYNSSFTINSPSKTGYTFNGWYTNSNLTNRYNKPSKYNVVGDTTLYAKFIPNDYQITFNNIYGLPLEYQSEEYLSGIENSKTVTYDSSFELPTPTHIGYNFEGWYIDTSFQNRFSPEKYNIADNIILYPKWTPKKFNLTFNLNGGISNGGTDLEEVSFYDKIPIPQEPTAPRGYKALEHWLLTPDDEQSIEWDFETRYTYLKNATLEAIYIPNIYKIIYYIGSEIEEQEVTFDSEYTLKIPTKTGYTFNGWYTDEDFQEEYIKAETYNEDKNINLYAKFIPNKYNITYTLNGGTFEDEETTQEVTFDSDFTVKVPTKKGYTFEGWYTDETLETEYNKPEKYDVAGHLQLYAKFVPNKYNINYTLNGGSFEDEETTQEVTFDSDFSLKIPTKTGYTFNGWYTDETLETEYNKPEKYDIADDLQLYAKFTPNEYNIIIKSSVDNSMLDTIVVTYDNGYSLPNLEIPNYKFIRYTYGGEKFESTGIYAFNKDIEIVANFEKIEEVKPPTNNGNNNNSNNNNNNGNGGSNNQSSSNDNNNSNNDSFINNGNSITLPNESVNKDNNKNEKNEKPNNNYFEDISNHWAKDTINDLAKKGIINGFNGKFLPDKNITREEAVLIIDRAVSILDLDLENKEPIMFYDKNEISNWAVESFDRLNEKGLVYGYGNNYFKPDRNITREEVICLLDRLIVNLNLYLEDTEITTFTDSDSISWWAVESFNNLANKGIINGYNLGYLYPKNNVTRAEFVTLINNILKAQRY